MLQSGLLLESAASKAESLRLLTGHGMALRILAILAAALCVVRADIQLSTQIKVLKHLRFASPCPQQ